MVALYRPYIPELQEPTRLMQTEHGNWIEGKRQKQLGAILTSRCGMPFFSQPWRKIGSCHSPGRAPKRRCQARSSGAENGMQFQAQETKQGTKGRRPKGHREGLPSRSHRRFWHQVWVRLMQWICGRF